MGVAMAQHRRNKNHNQRFYRYDLIVWRLAQLRTTPRQVALKADVSQPLMGDALSGECKKFETLWEIAKALGLKWEYLFKLDLPESQFRRAVLDGGSDSVR